VQDTYDKDSKERLTLEHELRKLQQLNTQLNQDAIALTNALTGSNNKAQGNWGEMVLEKVLESSGLTRNREYRVQVSDRVEQEDGSQRRYQPDVVIDLPEGKQLVIDSKVSLNAYVRYTASEDRTTQEAELKAHIAALRQHIRTLSDKRYQDLYKLNTLDFVFMFIPVEPAYLLAVQQDMSLFNEAFERRIMIVGPSTLLATLRTVASIWRYEYQNQNAQEIARQGGAMYDKLASLAESLEKVGRQIGQLQDSHQQAMRQLSSGSGNLLGRAEKLRKLGAKSSKSLPGHLLVDTLAENEAENAE
jgi:DNA recombination protein RmuC